ncbi:MAG: leucine-rich repeat domain-containing protein [Clostridia bacterium]|nr:leucine-rich repeat domain-containing protein [Clostridia bacterium]
MKRFFVLLLCVLLLAVSLFACVREEPEPLWPEETFDGERTLTDSITVSGVNYNLFSDKTADAVGIDGDSFSGTALRLPDAVSGYAVTGIANGAFQGLAVTELTLPGGLLRMGDTAFRQSGIKSLTLPDSLAQVGEDAFDGCRALKEVRFGKGLTEIPLGMFYGCVSLEEVVLPEGVTRVGEEAFSKCDALKKVTLPATLREIGPYAFWSTGTEDLVFAIPESVAAIGAGAFRETAWLDGQTEAFVIVGDGVLLRYNGSETEVAVPDDVKYLSDAFAGTQVKKVILPGGIRECENAWEETRVAEIIRADG